jgi:hypothetical protein
MRGLEWLDDRIKKLDTDLAGNGQEEYVLKRVSVNCKLVEDCILEVIDFIKFETNYSVDQYTQIECNKRWLPQIFAKRLVYDKCYLLENEKLYATGESSHIYCQQELEKVRAFFVTHKRFCQYYYSKRTDKDWLFFTPYNEDDLAVFQDYFLPTYLNPGCALTSCLLANVEYGKLLIAELASVPGTEITTKNERKVTFNRTETDVVEIVLGIHAAGIILVNGRPATQEFLIAFAREAFNVPLKNWQQLAKNIRDRKDPRLKMFPLLQDCLLGRIDMMFKSRAEERRLNSKRI